MSLISRQAVDDMIGIRKLAQQWREANHKLLLDRGQAEFVERVALMLRFHPVYPAAAREAGWRLLLDLFDQPDPTAFDEAEAIDDADRCAWCFIRGLHEAVMPYLVAMRAQEDREEQHASVDLEARLDHLLAGQPRLIVRPGRSGMPKATLPLAAGGGRRRERFTPEYEQLQGAEVEYAPDGRTLTLKLAANDSARDARQFCLRVGDGLIEPIQADVRQAIFMLPPAANDATLPIELLHCLTVERLQD